MLRTDSRTSEKLAELEQKIRALREEKARAVKVKDSAVNAAEATDDQASYDAAKAAVDAVKAIDARLEECNEQQVTLLRMAGGPTTFSGGSGWEEAARQ